MSTTTGQEAVDWLREYVVPDLTPHQEAVIRAMYDADRETLRERLRRAISRPQARGSVAVTLTADASAFAAELHRAAEGLQVTRERVSARRRFRRELQVAGLEGRYWVRAGLDPTFASEDRLLGLLLVLRRAPVVDGVRALTGHERRRVVMAAIKGWRESYGHDAVAVDLMREVLAWAEEEARRGPAR